MTNEELYKMAIEPQLKTIIGELHELKKTNAKQHNDLTKEVGKVHDRMFVTNGEKAITVSIKEHEAAIEQLKAVAHEPTMGRRRIAKDAAKVGGGASGLAIIHAVYQFIATHWHEWTGQ